MRRTDLLLGICLAILLTSAGLKAQQANSVTTGQAVTMNRLMTFNGSLKDSSGQPRLGTAGITSASTPRRKVAIRSGGRVRRYSWMNKAVTLSYWERLKGKDCRWRSSATAERNGWGSRCRANQSSRAFCFGQCRMA